jgi:hypothetical protein
MPLNAIVKGCRDEPSWGYQSGFPERIARTEPEGHEEPRQELGALGRP